MLRMITAVVVALQRDTRKVFDQALPNIRTAALTPALRPTLGPDAVVHQW